LKYIVKFFGFIKIDRFELSKLLKPNSN